MNCKDDAGLLLLEKRATSRWMCKNESDEQEQQDVNKKNRDGNTRQACDATQHNTQKESHKVSRPEDPVEWEDRNLDSCYDTPSFMTRYMSATK